MADYFEILTSKEFRDHLRLTLPPTPARAGWEFDFDALIEAIDYLGIKFPIHIRFITGKYRRGTHYARSNPDHHRITIDQTRLLGDANKTMWHELVHASQSEDWMKRTGLPHSDFYAEGYKYGDGDWGASYQDNLFEIEARKIADERCHNHPLLRHIERWRT